MMEKRRWNCVDALRVLALFLIILYHYETNLGTSNLISLEDMGIRYENANFHMAKIGVELFFMISGFGLMCGNYEISSWKKFLKSDF